MAVPKKLVDDQALAEIGSRIRMLREAKGLSQEYLATSVGVSQAAVSKWERGLSLPHETTQRRVADQLSARREYVYREAC